MSSVKSSLYPSQNFKKDDRQEESKVADRVDPPRDQRRPQHTQPPPRQQTRDIDRQTQIPPRENIEETLRPRSQMDIQLQRQQQQKTMNTFDHRLENILETMKEELTKKTYQDIYSPSKQKSGTNINFNGSFIISDDDHDDDRYDFYDRDEDGNIVVQPKIPIFPEDFTGEQKSWPLSWWGIVEPPKEFLDEINRIDNHTKNPIEKQDEVKEHVEQTAQHHRPHPNDHSRPGGRDYPEYKRQQHPQAWRNGPPNPHPRRDYGMYPPNRNPPPGRHEPPPYSSRHRDRRPY